MTSDFFLEEADSDSRFQRKHCMSRGMQKNARRVHINSFVTDALTVAHAKDGRIS